MFEALVHALSVLVTAFFPDHHDGVRFKRSKKIMPAGLVAGWVRKTYFDLNSFLYVILSAEFWAKVSFNFEGQSNFITVSMTIKP